jgi:predicted GNAT family acetyltransferase
MNVQIEHNKENSEFQTTINSEKSFLNYRKKSADTLEYYETFVPEIHRGKKVASQLATEALNYAQENNLKVIPTCPFINTFVKENNKFDDVIVVE